MKMSKKTIIHKVLYYLAISGLTFGLACNPKTESNATSEETIDTTADDQALDDELDKTINELVKEEIKPKSMVATKVPYKKIPTTIVEYVDTNSIEYNTYDIDVVRATSNTEIKETMSVYEKKLGLFVEGRELELISDEDPSWYQVNYYGKSAYIHKAYAVKETKKVFRKDMIAKGYLINNDIIYDNKELTKEIQSLNKLEFVEIYKELDDCYLVATIDNVGFVRKNNVGLLDGDLFVVDISNQEARIYEGNKLTLSAPVVTGMKNTAYASEKGLFKVWCKYQGRTNIVPGRPVDVGVFYNGDDGFHDASWQKNEWFGGNTYTYTSSNKEHGSGSHGCCNMRLDDALYANSVMEIGEKVLIKE